MRAFLLPRILQLHHKQQSFPLHHKHTHTNTYTFAFLAKPHAVTNPNFSISLFQATFLHPSLSFSFYPSPPLSFYPCKATKLEQLHLNMISQKYAMMPRLEIRPHSFSVITCRAVRTPTTTVTPLADIKAKPADPISLQSTWQHRAWVAAGSVAILSPLYKSISLVATAPSPVAVSEPVIAALFGYLMADLGSGFYHWAIDNYGDASTPFFGSQIDAFQGHHKYPYTITRRQVCNNLHALARSVAFVATPIDFLIGNNATAHAFVGACAGCIMLSQQFHAWAHEKKRKLPPVVAALQDAGVLVSRAEHATHHRSPYNSDYCIVSGVWNDFLDDLKVFQTLEMVLFFKLGVKPRSWSEPEKEWRVADNDRIGEDYYSFEK